jgi:hypothetical protein
MNQLTMELKNSEYLALDAPISEQILYRLDSGGQRFYYDLIDDEPSFYQSVTTFIGNNLKSSVFLDKWRAELGWDAASQFMDERAAYGTSMHILFSEYLMGEQIDLESDHIENTLIAQSEKDGVSFDRTWTDDLKHDLIAFAQFVYDYDVTPLMIEQVVAHGFLGGAIDLVCSMTIKEKGFFGETYLSGAKKGEPKESFRERRVTAMIDYKSGRKGFYVSHEIQLKVYQELFESVFPDYPIEKLYNFSPKDWISNPGYNLKDQTECESHAMIPHLKGLATCNGVPRPKDITVYKGALELGKVGNNYEKIDIAEYIREKHNDNH